MGDQLSIREAFASASEFLSPVLQRDELQRSCGQSLINILSQNTPEYSAENVSARASVIGKALGLLSQIHVAFVNPVIDAEQSSQVNDKEEDAALEDAKRRRILHALLDLIALEGIYPSLSCGVGIPLQQRVISVLPAGVIAQQNPPPPEKPPDVLLLGRILTELSGIIFDVRPSIQSVITGRILSDIISASSDLAYSPRLPASKEQSQYRQILAKVVDDTPSASLLPTLSAFLQSNPAPWFKSVITGLLSRVPLRNNGVLQTIVFLASQFAPSMGREAQEQGPSGLRITVNAIMHASRLLSAVPQGMEASAYFKVIGPQLLTLIDGDDPDLRKAAAYIIGNGILGKKAYGAPGAIGHSIFLDPIFKALTGTADASSRCYLMPPEEAKRQKSNQILSSEAEIVLAINRLKALVLQPPNPGLVKRVVYPVLLPLWGFACFSAQQQLKSIHEDVMIVLQTYFGISAGFPPLKKIVDNFLWTGGSTCAYSLDSQDGILLKKPNGAGTGSNIVALVDDLQSRAELFMSLLNADPSHDEQTSEVFLYVSETWLTQHTNNTRTSDKIQSLTDNGGSDGIIQNLISAKLAETLLDTFRDTLSRRPLKVLQLIKQILDGELRQASTHQKATSPASTKVSLSSLANIVPSEQAESNEASGNDSAESLQVVFSLLSTILASPEFTISKETSDLLATIKGRLDQLLLHLPPSLCKSGRTASMLLEIQLDSPEHQESKGKSVETPDFEVHRRALMNLNSELPPVQAEGFSLLSDLVKRSSPILDIPSTLTLLLSIIIDSPEAAANDEFIYLNAIKLIGILASRHPRTVTTTLIERYIDRSENATLDQRLKVGEALLRTAQDLGEALVGETAKILGEGLISVAGRRASKPQAQRSRKQALEQQRRKMEREERQRQKDASSGWRLSTPKIAEETLDNCDDSDSETPEQAVHSANIISAWAAGSSRDEEPDDLRVRASALSILATAVQTNITGLGPSILASCVDLALATLTLEPEDECAILRRASAVLLLDILKALDDAREKRKTQDIGMGFTLEDESSHDLRQGVKRRGPSTIGNIPFMLHTLAGVEARETDPIVRGHCRVLTESLEAWIEKSLLWGVGQYAGNRSEEHQPRLELGEQIAGLRINPLAGRGGHAERPRIEEIE